MQTLVELSTFSRASSGIFTAEQIMELTTYLAKNPEAGSLMPGTGGCRKLRFGIAGKGKRGGARVVYFYAGPMLPIFLLTVYAKSEKGNLTKAEQNDLAQLTHLLVSTYGERP